MYFKLARALYIKQNDQFKIAQNYTEIMSKMKEFTCYIIYLCYLYLYFIIFLESNLIEVLLLAKLSL